MDAVSITRKGNARTQVEKKDGKIVMTYDGVLSADGKTFTVQMKGTQPARTAGEQLARLRQEDVDRLHAPQAASDGVQIPGPGILSIGTI